MLVVDVTELTLLPALSESWSDRGQSSKKCRRTRPPDFSFPTMDSEDLQKKIFDGQKYLAREELKEEKKK